MIYLDNSATTRTLPQAAERAMAAMTEDYFNPSAAYSPAVAVERAVNAARATIAGAVGAGADELIFTSGGTESNNMAIFGSLNVMRGSGRIIVGATEHPSVFEPFHSLGKRYDVQTAAVDGQGRIDIEAFGRLVTADTRLVSIMQVNNEVGAINEIAALNRILKTKAPHALLHVDGVQGFLKVPFRARDCDLYSISGHKFHAPKGVGALYVKKGVRIAGGLMGGGQEGNLRSGTTNAPGILAMETAVKDYLQHVEAYREGMMQCKIRLYQNLIRLPDVALNGPEPALGAPHILNMSFMGIRGEVLLHALEEKSIFVATGSACSAHKKGKNRILTAMGIEGAQQEGAIRFSLCHDNTLAEMDETAAAVEAALFTLRRFKRR
ncbi:MAG: cysteine desulfurase family protein [Candidatus Pelethousia sp.]|nr:cysteine desulfurase family protein [Candidatus Pelethousia sp.]